MVRCFDSGFPEYGGFIVQDGDAFRYSTPQTSDSRNTLHFCRPVIPGRPYVGRYHTHPPGELGFSAIDKKGADEDQVLSFIGVMRENVILAYDPANGQTRMVGTINVLGAESVQFEPRVSAANAITVKVMAKFTTDPAYFGPGATLRIRRAIAAGTIPEEVAELMKAPEFAALVGAL